MARVIIASADDGADRHQLVHVAGEVGQKFANLNAGNAGANGIELAADFDRGIDLDVVHILMGRPTAAVNHDN